MEPIVLIHGYGAESGEATRGAIASIYGTLPEALRAAFGDRSVVEIDLGRYVSLEDGVNVDDLSRALNRAMEEGFPDLLKKGFQVVIHSTGALVIRNWIRRFSPKPSPLHVLVHLAGANFGSGWAHLGKGQLAKWARKVFPGGGERGVQILEALELGSDWTLELHLHFLRPGNRMAEDYRIREYVIVGSQADVQWYMVPIRYAKEDGSDGVVRVCASDLNYQYLRFGPTDEARELDWSDAQGQLARSLNRTGNRRPLYEVKEASRPGREKRPETPLAIPYACAHSGKKLGIVTGTEPREQVMPLLRRALGIPGRTSPGAGSPIDGRASSDPVAAFREETELTYRKVREAPIPSLLRRWIDEPRAQYDHHAQVIFRVRDQDGRPVSHFDIFFDSAQGPRDRSLPMRELFEDKHVNSLSPHIITFYLRTDAFANEKSTWIPRLPQVDGCFLEVSALEPQTGEIVYLPLRYEFTAKDLGNWIRGDRTTIVDVELLRLPAPGLFRIVPF